MQLVDILWDVLAIAFIRFAALLFTLLMSDTFLEVKEFATSTDFQHLTMP